MVFDPLSAAIAVGGNLIGGMFGQSQQASNQALQREFAQNAISWRVADAKRAGIHPLYAMGAPTMSPAVSAFSPMGDAISKSGQDISRAMMAGQTAAEREATMGSSVVMNQLSLERAQLNNEILKTQLAKMRGQLNPPAPAVNPEKGNFDVPENTKPEQRPPLMLAGQRWMTNPNTSPMKAWEDQYGDEGPVASSLPLFILYNDLMHNTQHSYHPDKWLSNAWKWLDKAAATHLSGKEVETAEKMIMFLWQKAKERR